MFKSSKYGRSAREGENAGRECTRMKISREIGIAWVERKGKDICWDGIFFFIQLLLTGGNGHKKRKNKLGITLP